MPLTFSSKGSGPSQRVSPGSHFAVCDMVIFLGLQETTGQFAKLTQQLYIRFEIPAERWKYEKDGKPMEGPAVIGRTFTASMHKKAGLRKQLEGWRGKTFTEDEASSFDVTTILGAAFMLSVTENESGGTVYSNIAGFSGLPKGSIIPKAEFPLRLYMPDDTSCFESLPEWLRDKITNQIKPEPTKSGVKTVDENGRYSFDNAFDQTPPIEAYANVHDEFITDDDIPF